MALLVSLVESHAPPLLRSSARRVGEQLVAASTRIQQDKLLRLLSDQPHLAAQLTKACVTSRYLLDSVANIPELLFHWLLTDAMETALSPSRITELTRAVCDNCDSVESLNRALRTVRRRVMTALIWRDINGLADFSEVSQCMTALAEACIQQALNFHYPLLVHKHGTPMGRCSQLPQQLFVIGMGKLGGAELNVSSDIDLMFVFPESGETDHPSRPLDNESFFVRLGQAIIKSLQATTADGFVFRVDMRLRPYGQSGALVTNFDAFEHYYRTQGRDWERFAAIKARVVASTRAVSAEPEALKSDLEGVERIDGILQSFAYRPYTDFSVLESLRQLKAMIVEEVRRKGLEGNVKLGAGGIRELEFIVQSFQLVNGGRLPQLRERHWLTALSQLEQDGLLVDASAALSDAYLFLRNTEHRIQYYQDQQTQQLPDDLTVQQILAWSMGVDSWSLFLTALDAHRQVVSQQFALVFTDPEDKTTAVVHSEEWSSLWQQTALGGETYLALSVCSDPQKVVEQLAILRESWSIKQLAPAAHEALDIIIPQLLSAAAQVDNPDITLLRMLQWLQKVVGRSSYMTLLIENPAILKPLALLFEGSAWIAELLGQMPSLLNQLLDGERLYYLPSKTELQDELRLSLLRTDPDDIESVLEVLRYFKLAHSLRVAASDLAGAIPLMKVSDYLTWIAEVVLEQVSLLAWQQMSAKHGVPSVGDALSSSSGSVKDFLIIGYGKLGGIELSYSSDLDLVFLYDAEPNAVTDGDKPIDATTFFTRLGQKIIHILNIRSLSGPLYEVDMRLRPSGNSGMLATSLTAFTKYQLQEAWTWEHQALVRARPITGDEMLANAFLSVRKQVLQKQRDLEPLREAVLEMREKMREHLGSDSTNRQASGVHNAQEKSRLFHLKQDAGGIVDIEFMVQYAALAWAHKHPEFVDYTDNVRLLSCLQASGYIAEDDAELLTTAYTSYREVTHRLALQKQSALLTEEQYLQQFASYELPQKNQQIIRLWNRWFSP